MTDAINYINNSFSEFLQENRLESKKQQTTFTPRRLVLLVTDLQTQQTDIEIIKNGPSRKIALSENGMPSKALDGFLRSNNASIGDVYWQDIGKGEVAHLKIKQIGVPTNELLKNWLSALIAGIPFPKKMKWGSGNLEFARPIRWLICLWGDDVLPCSIDGISADRISYGNRFLDLESRVSVINTQHYCSALKEIFVLTDRQERYDNIKKQLSDIFADGQHQVDIDEGLLQTVTDLVEYPTAVIAEFEEKYLVLPEMIVTSTISQNQKYFAVKDQSGKLTNKFVFISNGNPEYGELIRKGNEKVVKPRLEDAMWYFQEDTKHKLEEYVPKLQEVVFHKELGSVKDKTDRIIKVSEYLCKQLNLSDKDTSQTHRTALLCKADLVTKMLGEKEFTKLQGYIGMHYAIASNEPDNIPIGIYEHYMPRGQNDELPSTINGAVVAVSDKLDTVCGIIGIGLHPTGSADPFALRRAANGIVQIVAENKWNIDIIPLVDNGLDCFEQAGIKVIKNRENVLGFFHQRINWYLQRQNVDYDVIDSVMHIDFGNILHLMERAKALQDFKADADFIKLIIGFKRVSNIVKDEKHQYTIDEQVFVESAEKALYTALTHLEKSIETELLHLKYINVLQHLVGIRDRIDDFFDKVLVNTDDIKLRNNRYALLQKIRSIFLKVADLSLIVVDNKADAKL